VEKDKTNAPVIITSNREWPVTALAVSPDGTRVAWGCNGKYNEDRKWIKPEESLVMLDADSGRELWNSKVGRGDYQALSFAGDGKSLAVVQPGKVVLLDPANGQVLQECKHPDYLTGPLSTVLSQDGNLCAVGYAPNSIGLWDARAGKCLRTLKAHSNWVVSLAFTPDGSLLASSAGDTTASVWETATGKEVGRFRFGDGAAYIDSVSISDDGRWLAAGRQGEYVVLELPKLKPADQN
jgi:WD40 repeat protein